MTSHPRSLLANIRLMFFVLRERVDWQLSYVKDDLLECMKEEYERLGRPLDLLPPDLALSVVTEYYNGGQVGPIPGTMGTPIPGLDDEEEDEAQPTEEPPTTFHYTCTNTVQEDQWHLVAHDQNGVAAGQVPLPPFQKGPASTKCLRLMVYGTSWGMRTSCWSARTTSSKPRHSVAPERRQLWSGRCS